MGPGAKAGLGYGLARGLTTLGDTLMGISDRRKAEQVALAQQKRADAQAERNFKNAITEKFGGLPDVVIGGERPSVQVGRIGNKGMMAPYRTMEFESPSGEVIPVHRDTGYEDRRKRAEEMRGIEQERGAHRALGTDQPFVPGVDYTGSLGRTLSQPPREDPFVTINTGGRVMRVPANEAGSWDVTPRPSGGARTGPDPEYVKRLQAAASLIARSRSDPMADPDMIAQDHGFRNAMHVQELMRTLGSSGMQPDLPEWNYDTEDPLLNDDDYWNSMR